MNISAIRLQSLRKEVCTQRRTKETHESAQKCHQWILILSRGLQVGLQISIQQFIIYQPQYVTDKFAESYR